MQHAPEVKTSLFITYVEFRKAFDLVPHVHLWTKILNAGIDGKFLKTRATAPKIHQGLLYCLQSVSIKSQTSLLQYIAKFMNFY